MFQVVSPINSHSPPFLDQLFGCIERKSLRKYDPFLRTSDDSICLAVSGFESSNPWLILGKKNETSEPTNKLASIFHLRIQAILRMMPLESVQAMQTSPPPATIQFKVRLSNGRTIAEKALYLCRSPYTLKLKISSISRAKSRPFWKLESVRISSDDDENG